MSCRRCAADHDELHSGVDEEAKQRAEIGHGDFRAARPPDVVIEIRSPGDESLEKLPFYESLGVPEAWIVDRDTRRTALHVLTGEGDDAPRYVATDVPESDWLLSETTGVELRCELPGKLSLRLRDDEASREDVPQG